MVTLDGSSGEGGGQILRTSLALSLTTGLPFQIVNIRGRRKRPGLLRQHLTSVNAAAEIGRAEVLGASLGSSKLTFTPSAPSAGNYHFEVGSAGSTTLVLQAVLPSLLTASKASQITIEGGTHNPYAPPYDFLAKSFLPLLNRMGPSLEARLHRPGFYPAGGGRLEVSVTPCPQLKPLKLLTRGEITGRRGTVLIANLPRHIAERELDVLTSRLGWPADTLSIQKVHGVSGPGNVVLVELVSTNITEVVTAFGRRGVRAESIATEAASQAERYLSAGVPVGEHLADQLLVPLALAGGGEFVTLDPSQHMRTNIEVIKAFLDVDVRLQQEAPDVCRVLVG